MKIISKTFKLLTVFLLVLGVTGCSDDDDNNGGGTQSTTVDEIIDDNPNLSILEEALELTDLDDVLEQTGPYTVFAPTNAAFVALLGSNPAWNTLSDIPTATLNSVLLNHVIVGNNIPAQALIDAGSGYETTASPGPAANTNLSLYYNVVAGTVEINGGSDVTGGADVTTADLTATNGTVHIVDAVIALPTIATFATTNDALSSLVAALQLADSGTPTVNWINTVSGTENENLAPFTVFAPTNDAFASLLLELDDTGNTELADLDPDLVNSVLTYHVVTSANVQSSGLGALNGVIPTLGGNLDLDGTTITDANGRESEILAPSLVDIQATNGVVHAIDVVILPPQ
ncbi:fasciclin domain-containing protein [Winogradskyella luteola]|uniref:Fasciclin domain-containing protein n=1 Tax=Winogradskyella luteola TaxID=2828330 RepID=A0A9X1JM57_9FLAO|nr:fasciclin domain-containing protein [Winogradskyella luteola]MBV7267941.1 fasciclin domain-containing protein [Winogradskyella luteola]